MRDSRVDKGCVLSFRRKHDAVSSRVLERLEREKKSGSDFNPADLFWSL